jgi:hypothetical protein
MLNFNRNSIQKNLLVLHRFEYNFENIVFKLYLYKSYIFLIAFPKKEEKRERERERERERISE